jgi:hypothetical protein
VVAALHRGAAAVFAAVLEGAAGDSAAAEIWGEVAGGRRQSRGVRFMTSNSRKIIIPFLLVFFFGFRSDLLFAAEDAGDEVLRSPAVVGWDFSAWCKVDGHLFNLEKTTLGDVVRTFGAGKISRDGDAGAAVFEWLVEYKCGKQIIRFESNNDMGGDTHLLDEIEIRPEANGLHSVIHVIHGPIIFPFGEFGISFKALQKVLGNSRLAQGRAEYQFENRISGQNNGRSVESDVSSWMRVKVVSNHMTELDLSRITTY